MRCPQLKNIKQVFIFKDRISNDIYLPYSCALTFLNVDINVDQVVRQRLCGSSRSARVPMMKATDARHL